MDLRMMRDMARGRRDYQRGSQGGSSRGGSRGSSSMGRSSQGSRDGRNPYGSRGGYVVSSRSRRDRARGRNDYESYGTEYDSNYGSDYATGEYNTRDSVYGRELYGYYGDTPFEIRRSYPMQDRDMNYMDYARGGRGRSMDYGYDYGYDYRRDYGMDYGEGSSMLDEEELDEWLEELKEDFDNREKEMFKEEKIMQRAKEMGIKFDHFTPKEYLVTAVMLYKDYKKTLGMANVDIYLKLAKDWLMDDDVEMKHGEKLAAYYDNVVMAE